MYSKKTPRTFVDRFGEHFIVYIMYAVVEIAGKQYKVENKQQLFVDKLEGNEGDKVEFAKVLLVDDKGSVTVGAPTVDGAKVSAKINAQVKSDTVLVFKKKRRKGYQKMNGHRQHMTSITIDKISA